MIIITYTMLIWVISLNQIVITKNHFFHSFSSILRYYAFQASLQCAQNYILLTHVLMYEQYSINAYHLSFYSAAVCVDGATASEVGINSLI